RPQHGRGSELLPAQDQDRHELEVLLLRAELMQQLMRKLLLL
ncbi:unnamed protein product, partial [Urochloa humidicola]